MNERITMTNSNGQGHPVAVLTPATSGPKHKRVSRLAVGTIGFLGVVLLTGAFVLGAMPRLRQQRELNAATEEAASAVPRVSVAIAKQVSSDSEQLLPGNALPLLEAALYPRATGYVKTRLVDIGDRVREGQLLAEIDSPDTDDQLAQAQANLVQARANLDKARADLAFARSDEVRYRRMVATLAAAQEDYDRRVQASGVASANVEAMAAAIKVSEAAVQRWTDLQRFEKITAPFPGVITARQIDPGDLVAADSTGRELFHLMRTDVLRVFVDVPQVFATGIKVGRGAVIFRREDPRTEFQGKVTRTADALDPATRTLRTEVQVKNLDNALRPGMYLQVKFTFNRATLPVLIPAAALATRSEGPRVAVLDQQRVSYRNVQLGRDYGAEIEIVAGINPGEMVVVHPGDDLPEGAEVTPVLSPK